MSDMKHSSQKKRRPSIYDKYEGISIEELEARLPGYLRNEYKESKFASVLGERKALIQLLESYPSIERYFEQQARGEV